MTKLYTITGTAPEIKHRGMTHKNVSIQFIRFDSRPLTEDVYRAYCTNYDVVKEKELESYLHQYFDEAFTEEEVKLLQINNPFAGFTDITVKEMEPITVHEEPGRGLVMPASVGCMGVGGGTDMYILSPKGLTFQIGAYFDLEMHYFDLEQQKAL